MKGGSAGGPKKAPRRDIDEERRRLRDEFGVLDSHDDSGRVVMRYLTLAETADLAGPMPSSAGLLRLIAPSARLMHLRLLLTLPPKQELPKPQKPKGGFWGRLFGRHVEDIPEPVDALDHWVASLPEAALVRLIHSLEARRLEIHVRSEPPAEGRQGLMILNAPESRDRTRVFRGAIVGATPPDEQRKSGPADLLVFVDRDEQVERLQHQFDDWWDDALPRRQELLRFAREHLERISGRDVPGLPAIRLTMSPPIAPLGEKQEVRVAWAHVTNIKLERALGEGEGWRALIQQPGSHERKGTFRGRFPIQSPGPHYLRATGIDGTGRVWVSPEAAFVVDAPPIELAAEVGATETKRPPEKKAAEPEPQKGQDEKTSPEAQKSEPSKPEKAEAKKPEAKQPEPGEKTPKTQSTDSDEKPVSAKPEDAKVEKKAEPEEAVQAKTEPSNGSATKEPEKVEANDKVEVTTEEKPAADPKNPSPRLFYEMVLNEVFSRPMSTGLTVPTNRIKSLSGDDAMELIEELATPSSGNVRLEDVLRVQYVELKREPAFVDRMAACLKAIPLVVELQGGDAPFDLLLVRRNREPLLLPWDRETEQILDGEDLATLTILEQARAKTAPSRLPKLPFSLGVVIRRIRERFDVEKQKPKQLPRAMAKALTRLDMIALSTEDSSLQIHSDALRTQLASVPPPIVAVDRLESLVKDGATVPNKEFVQLMEDFLMDLEEKVRQATSHQSKRHQKVRVDLLGALVRPTDGESEAKS